MGLFSDLSKLGLKQFEEVDLYVDKKKPKETVEDKVAKKKIVTVEEKDILFDKTYLCPVCDHSFKAKTVMTGKVKSNGRDTDLRPRYKVADPLKYDAIVCEKCGYSALTRFFGHLTSHQIKQIKADISGGFKGVDNTQETYSYDDAIIRHKLALACCLVKGSKYSERAYICLKLAWLIRGKYELLEENDPQIASLKEEELECIANAYEGFSQAFSKENFPICGMNESTITYLVAELAFRLGKYEPSLKLLSKVLLSNNANARIKSEALDLKERIKSKIK